MSEPRIRVGLLGAGNSGFHYHARANLMGSAEFELTVVAVERRTSATRVAEALGVDVVTDWRAVVADDEIDAVVVALPHHLHLPAALAAIEAGKHVLVDKPMALDTAECDTLIAAAERHGVLLEVFQQRRWEEDFQALLGLVADGRIGDVWRIEVARFHRGHYRVAGAERPHNGDDVLDWPLRLGAGGGISFLIAPHPVDHLLTLAARPVRDVRGRVHVRPGDEVEDWIGVDVDFDGGVTGHVSVWREALASPPRFVLHGTAGTLVATDATSIDVLTPGGGHERLTGFAPPTELGGEVYAGFADAIRGRGELRVGAAAGRAVVDVLDRARRTAGLI